MKKLVTHNGTFHPDDIFAAAVVELYLEQHNESWELFRTRDEEIIESADYVWDVGGIYDPEKNKFDHHQIEGAGNRPNGIPYASFGLVWKKFGLPLCNDNQWVVDFIDKKLVAGIDATDNGTSIRTKIFEDVEPYEFNNIVGIYLPAWNEKNSPELLLENFNEIVILAKKILSREIKKTLAIFDAEKEVEKKYHETDDKRIIILDNYYPWKHKLASFPEPLICVFPNDLVGNWIAYCVPKEMEKFASRVLFPKDWAGLRDHELAEKTGVADAVFCHRGLFMAVAASREGAVELAKKALLM